MEVKLGVTYSPKELVVETDQSTDDVAKLVEEAVGGKSKVLWLADTKGRRVGVPTEKLAYIELGEEHPTSGSGSAPPEGAASRSRGGRRCRRARPRPPRRRGHPTSAGRRR